MRMIKNKKVIDELKRISTLHRGLLRPEDVVETAKNKINPLHDQFDWDDRKAGHLWRLEQARNLIQICVEIIPNTDIHKRVFVSLSSDRKKDGGGYREFTDVMNNKMYKDIMLKDALNEMNYFVHKYQELKELGRVFNEIKKVQKKFR